MTQIDVTKVVSHALVGPADDKISVTKIVSYAIVTAPVIRRTVSFTILS
jgi:hypothetical protein